MSVAARQRFTHVASSPLQLIAFVVVREEIAVEGDRRRGPADLGIGGAVVVARS